MGLNGLFITPQETEYVKTALEYTLKFKTTCSISLHRWDIDIFPLLDKNNELQFIVQNLRTADHTEILKTEDASEAIERFDILSKATNEAIWDWNIGSGKVIWNKGIKGIFGFNMISYDHNWWMEKVHPDDVERITKEIQDLISTKNSKLKAEYRFRCANGTYKNVLDRGFLIFDKNGEPVRMIGSMQDITERVNYIGAIEKQNARLQEISWMQSHQVRAPLARILGLSDLLFDYANDEESKELISHLIKSAAELDNVVRNIVKKTEFSG